MERLAARLLRYLLRLVFLPRPAAPSLPLLQFLRRHYQLRRFARSLQRPRPVCNPSLWVSADSRLLLRTEAYGLVLVGEVERPTETQLLIAQS